MKRRQRLLKTADFDRVIRGGRRSASTYLALFVSDNEVGRPRVGFAVSRKLGNAVVRNRIKRRLRAVTRPLAEATQAAQDVVIVARARAIDADSASLGEELGRLWSRRVEA